MTLTGDNGGRELQSANHLQSVSRVAGSWARLCLGPKNYGPKNNLKVCIFIYF